MSTPEKPSSAGSIPTTETNNCSGRLSSFIFVRSVQRCRRGSPTGSALEPVWQGSPSPRQPPHYEANHGHLDERLAALHHSLVVLAQTAIMYQLRKSPL